MVVAAGAGVACWGTGDEQGGGRSSVMFEGGAAGCKRARGGASEAQRGAANMLRSTG